MLFSIPKDGLKRTGLDAILAANTMLSLERHAPALSLQQSIRGTDPGTRRVETSPADNHHKTFTNTPGRADVDTHLFQPAVAQPPDAGKHTRLTANTTICIDHR
jgi:hypothetical protein